MVVVVSLVLDFVQQLFGCNMFNKDAYQPYRWEMVKSKLTFASTFSKPSVSFLNLGLAEKTSII
jgi:hypothetical protein